LRLRPSGGAAGLGCYACSRCGFGGTAQASFTLLAGVVSAVAAPARFAAPAGRRHSKEEAMKVSKSINPEEFDPSVMWIYHDRECPHCGDPAVVPEGYNEGMESWQEWQEYNTLRERATRFICVGCEALFNVQKTDGGVVRKVINHN
jgi:hypothetical protein